MSEKPRACSSRRYIVTTKDLPLSCPLPGQRLWDAHPRIYLPISATGHVVCPYCEAHFILKDTDKKD